MSVDLYPVRPKPCPDELLSSWLRRVAYGNSAKVQGFCNLEWPGVQIWNRDIDALAPDALVERLSDRTATPRARASATTLRGYEGVLVERVQPNGASRWLTRAGIYHRVRRRHGLQWCPACLGEDEQPYYRRRWRLALATCCPLHGVRLLDGCHACDMPAAPHRVRTPACQACGADRRAAPLRYASPRVAAFERRAQGVLAGDAVTMVDFMGEHPLAFFGLYHRLLVCLASGPRAARFRQVAARDWGGDAVDDLPWMETGRSVEDCRADDRHRLADLAVRLLDGWPWMFVASAAEAGLWKWWALKDRPANELPYLFVEPVRRSLSQPYVGRGSMRVLVATAPEDRPPQRRFEAAARQRRTKHERTAGRAVTSASSYMVGALQSRGVALAKTDPEDARPSRIGRSRMDCRRRRRWAEATQAWIACQTEPVSLGEAVAYMRAVALAEGCLPPHPQTARVYLREPITGSAPRFAGRRSPRAIGSEESSRIDELRRRGWSLSMIGSELDRLPHVILRHLRCLQAADPLKGTR